MVLEKLGDSLRAALRKIAGASYVDEALIKEIVRDIQRALLVGLYGQGKTTTAGKLGKYFQKKGLSVGFVAADVHRPAAYDQLKQLSEQISVGFYGDPKAKDAVKIARAGLKALEGMDVLIVDSSGRHALEPDLI